MNHSTEGVTLYAMFPREILNFYDCQKAFCGDLFSLAEGLDLSHPHNQVPIAPYNQMCQWVENHFGQFNIIRLGRHFANLLYDYLEEEGWLNPATPLNAIKGLQYAADNLVQDPYRRGFELLEGHQNSLVVRRTQTFNSRLQFGLLDGLVAKTGAQQVEVSYFRNIEQGNPYDDYLITFKAVAKTEGSKPTKKSAAERA